MMGTRANERESGRDDTGRYLDGLDGLSDISVDERQKMKILKTHGWCIGPEVM